MQPPLPALNPVSGAWQGICDILMVQEALAHRSTPFQLHSKVDFLQRAQLAAVKVKALILHLCSDSVLAVKYVNHIKLAFWLN